MVKGEQMIKWDLVKNVIDNSYKRCLKCNGEGIDKDLHFNNECKLCKGLGYIEGEYEKCPKCDGDGKIYLFPIRKVFLKNVIIAKVKDIFIKDLVSKISLKKKIIIIWM